jgi:cell division protease FtsH
MLGATLAGHVAEELVLGEMTTGPQNDIEQATKIARQMVTQWGMSERLGPRTFGRKEELVFLGREISEQRNYSEKVAEEIDEEVRRIIDRAYHVAKKILTENRPKLDQIARKLIEIETIEGDDLMTLFNAPVDVDVPIGQHEPPSAETPPSAEGEPPAEEPSPQPKLKPGLAWGGGQATITLRDEDPPTA